MLGMTLVAAEGILYLSSFIQSQCIKRAGSIWKVHTVFWQDTLQRAPIDAVDSSKSTAQLGTLVDPYGHAALTDTAYCLWARWA